MSAQKQEDQEQLPYKDDPTLKEVFVDHIRSTLFDGQTIRIECALVRSELVGPDKHERAVHPTARLVLTGVAGVQLHQYLSRLLQQLEEHGVLKRVGPASETKQ
jgi:hypothetical protein